MRQFKPEKLFKPRDFIQPELTDNCYLEIGAGRGLHAIQFAQTNPDKQLIAIERTRVKFEDFAERASKERLENLTPIHADAIPWVVHALPPQSLNGIFLLYPNPEPKNAAQRWLNMPFFEFLISRLKPNGKVILATNIKDYFDEAVEQTVQVWKLPYHSFNIDENSKRTHFEIKYLARGEACYQIDISKPESYSTRFDLWSSN